MLKREINITVPTAWNLLSDAQLRHMFSLMSRPMTTEELRLRALLYLSGTEVLSRSGRGAWLLHLPGGEYAEVTAGMLAPHLDAMAWTGELPPYPVRLSHIGIHAAAEADLQGVPFEVWLALDNLMQGFLTTHDESLADDMVRLLYSEEITDPTPAERTGAVWWVSSLRSYFCRKFPDLFRAGGDTSSGNLLGTVPESPEASMNAQIRALTKGDITKEAEVLSLDTHRALAELNAQAREYRELNEKYNARK